MTAKKPRVLVVDDDSEMAEMIADHLGASGYVAECAAGGNAALAALRRRSFDAVITDLRMDEVDGFDVLRASLEDDPARPVLIMTAYGTIDSAIDALRRGAAHYLTKPFKLGEACLFLERSLADRGLRTENEQLRRLVDERFGFQGLIGKSASMQQLYDLLSRVAAASAPVLLLGESGTGKELVARAIHFGGPRAKAPFVAVNCAALPEQLLESELFGHARGAFTGATEAKKGLFVEANEGTLLLDEIGELPLPLQAKLLRALESSAIRPVGGAAERSVDVRIVAATNRDLAAAVQEKRFREDLYYRLHVIPIHLPPLRDRREDIPLLVEHFVRRYAERHRGAPPRQIGADVMKWLIDQPWPGNVRELENTVERLLLLARGTNADLRDLSPVAAEPAPEALPPLGGEIVPLRVMQRRYVEWVLSQTGGNKVRAAQLLGIDASTIYRMLARGE
ncbi:MAG: sigma-54-dependent Fis family transcriptional regulator [Planctomycetes bacterium]|nr:sigma-54-dependent Fis family transcriptional regulator [Planctomycetota bacterium]